MPNYCDFAIKVNGSKNAIERIVNCLNADYNYGVGKPDHKHFFRVFEVNDSGETFANGKGNFTKYIYGYCAWSVRSCMCRGVNTYYNDCKKNHPDIFMGTSLVEQSKDCEIEVFSEETEGMMFSEHYLFRNGMKVVDETCDIEYEEDGEDDFIYHNPHRDNDDDDYNWTI